MLTLPPWVTSPNGQPLSLTKGERIRESWYIHTTEHCWAMKEQLIPLTRCLHILKIEWKLSDKKKKAYIQHDPIYVNSRKSIPTVVQKRDQRWPGGRVRRNLDITKGQKKISGCDVCALFFLIVVMVLHIHIRSYQTVHLKYSQLIVHKLLYLHKAVKKFTWKYKGPRVANTSMQKINSVVGLRPLDFKNCYNATVIISVWYWHVVRQIDPCNSI